MIRVELTRDEVVMLRELLSCCLDDLRGEIRHTDRRDYRNMLKEREGALRQLLERLEDETSRVAA